MSRGASLLAFALACAPASALAGTFLADGTFVFDPAAVVTIDFEDDDTEPGITTQADEVSLSGKNVLPLMPYQGVDLPVVLPATRATYRVSLWVNSAEVIGDLELSYSGWADGPPGEPPVYRVDEVAGLYPTGRVTSDGWIELANDNVRVDGLGVTAVSVGLFAAAGGKVDAVEFVPDGDEGELPVVPNAPCDGAAFPNSCGVGQVCMWSQCRNTAGWVPPIPADREEVTDYLAQRMNFLFGPFLEREEDLPASLVYVEQMRNAPDPYTYWSAFLAGVRRLHDGHTTTYGLADFVLPNPRPLNFCAIEGDADLSHGVAPKDPEYLDVLVSHAGVDYNQGLQPGDRIVHVDGQHPIAWARSLLGVSWTWPTTSNHTTFAELASSLPGLVSRYAKEIEVVRCDAATSICGALETISIKDIPLEVAPASAGLVTCDNRPLRHVPGAPELHDVGETVYAGLLDEDDSIFGLEWESLYTSNGTDGVGQALSSAVATWRASARGVVLDHRTGFGGTILAPEILWDYAVPSHALDMYRERSFAGEPPLTTAQGLAYFDAAVQSGVVQMCGSADPATDVPVALLVTQDVSASDWLPLGMKGAPKVKVFGPYQTNGGFSTRYVFGYWLGLNYVMAVGDDILADGSTHNGVGVEPDVVVLPKQSDLVAGKDTVFEAAMDWVRQELAP